MQEAGSATAGGRPEFKITRRWPELYLGPLFLLLLCASIYCLVLARGGGRMWLGLCQSSSVLCVCVVLFYVLLEKRLPYRVTGRGFRISCDRPELLREISAETIFTAEVLPLLPVIHRFKTSGGDLMVYGPIIHLARLAEALVSADELDRAVGQMQFPKSFKTVFGWRQFADIAVLMMPLAAIGALVETTLKVGSIYDEASRLGLGVLAPTVEMAVDFVVDTLAPIAGIYVGVWLVSKWAPPKQWTFTPAAPGISEVQFTGKLKWALRATYVMDGMPKKINISQFKVTQSLLPLYFFLRSKCPVHPGLDRG